MITTNVFFRFLIFRYATPGENLAGGFTLQYCRGANTKENVSVMLVPYLTSFDQNDVYFKYRRLNGFFSYFTFLFSLFFSLFAFDFSLFTFSLLTFHFSLFTFRFSLFTFHFSLFTFFFSFQK